MTGASDNPGEPRIQSFGRKRGRPLRAGRRKLFAELLPEIEFAPPAGRDPAAIDRASLDPATMWGEPGRETWLEIGFGAGEHLAWQAGQHPGIGFIGAEVYEAGIGVLLSAIAREGLANIRIHAADAVTLLDALPARSIARAFVLFPDPWPKRRHWKRRLVSAAGLARLARVLADDAELRLATDDPSYLTWMLQHILASPDFIWTARRARDWLERPEDWPETRYEAKAIRDGRRPCYLRLIRRRRKREA
ncbi:MAG TPA: tRNA (guanine(46)-N(7))-methyltransferase TrmB [Alphaproteobacteria bacterium]|nr:tRNA (guanine(46)-N(7))-methyltransferase TrmB [Alphaproteobacteria bacterium]